MRRHPTFNTIQVTMRVILDRRKIKCCILIVLVIMVVLHLHLGYPCVDRDCVPSPELTLSRSNVVEPDSGPHDISADHWRQRGMERIILASRNKLICPHETNNNPDTTRGNFLLQNHTMAALDPEYTFDPDSDRDVLVFLHIQKTGGTTFGRHLVSNLRLATPCQCEEARKKCECRNRKGLVWTVSRYSTGWRCGLHADWTELTHCVDTMLDRAEGEHRERRYLYMTILREPITRYISEFKHVQRGATWKAARLQCDGRQASLQEVPFCFEDTDWAGVSLDGFMQCPHNLANNRQVRMLSNLSLSGCYKHGVMSSETRDCSMLNSAMENLRHMPFFGLTEYQQETQYLFEETFGLKFHKDFFQYNHTHADEIDITPHQQRRIRKLNKLDIQLYQYAKDLFSQRLQQALRVGRTKSSVQANNVDESGSIFGSDMFVNVDIPLEADYEEGDENDAEGDDEYNHRISKTPNIPSGRTAIHTHQKRLHYERSLSP